MNNHYTIYGCFAEILFALLKGFKNQIGLKNFEPSQNRTTGDQCFCFIKRL